ncbi:FecR family protein [Portibacter lacus]|uniref:Anti-sigma factor n=1 Tax=Portibacter lacus TaxID=1099794 RepID=A0AA37SYW7_9BACT|nr:FecR family protein [Portibacter lacus]GLR20105.1 anti-sigma factor [Portibacter lacus]
MHDNSVITLLHKQLTNQLEGPDKRLLLDWLENSSQNVEEQKDVSKIWELSGNYEPSFEPDVNKGFERFSNRIQKEAIPQPTKVLSLNPIKAWMKYAAVAAVLISSVLVWQLTQSVNVNQLMVSTISNEIKSIDLPDGSKVWINEKSSFSYPDKFNGSERVVSLDGQAFFEIEKNAKKPFIIQGGDADVKVLGTSFSFDTENMDGLMEVEVKTGTVEIKPKGSSESFVLTKNEKGYFDSDKKMFLEKELLSVSNADFFITNKYKFVNSKYTFVFGVLEDVYDVDFEFGNEGLENCEFTSPIEFDKNNIQSALNVIERVYKNRNLTIEKVENNKYIINADPCN